MEVEEPLPGEVELWDEARIREGLELQGELFHGFMAVGPDDQETWLHTERDLRAIAPPLTRVLNRYDATRAAAAAGDEILLAAAISRYGVRNYARRRRLLAAQAAQEPQPITGARAPEGTGPESDEEWQRTQGGEIFTEPPDLTPRRARR